MKILKTSLIVFLLTFTAGIYSQETVISLKQAILNAYKNDPNIIKTENTIEAQESSIRARRQYSQTEVYHRIGQIKPGYRRGDYFINESVPD
jgi:hypothetical protein